MYVIVWFLSFELLLCKAVPSSSFFLFSTWKLKLVCVLLNLQSAGHARSTIKLLRNSKFNLSDERWSSSTARSRASGSVQQHALVLVAQFNSML